MDKSMECSTSSDESVVAGANMNAVYPLEAIVVAHKVGKAG